MTQQQADTVVNGDGGDVTDEGQKGQSELEKKLTETNTKLMETSFYAKMMQDPELGAVLQARAAGQKIKIIPADQATQPASLVDQVAPIAEKEVDLSAMDNKQLTQHLMRENAKMMEKLIDTKLAPVTQQLQQVHQTTANQVRKDAEQEVTAVRTKYPDFDQHLTAIAKLNAENPNLKPLQLYKLAKAEAGEPIVEGRQLASERPGTSSARPATRTPSKNKTQQVGSSMLALRDVIRESAARRLGDGTIDSSLDE